MDHTFSKSPKQSIDVKRSCLSESDNIVKKRLSLSTTVSLAEMTVEDSTVRIIGSDTERLENGEGRRSESEEENIINKENISVEDEGMDKGGWAWVVVLGELLFITRSTILFLLAGDALCMTMVNVMFTLTFVTFILSFSIFSSLQPPSSATW